jgi:hypothetical protein
MIRSMRGLMVAAILAASAFAMSAAPAFATDLSVTAASVVPGSGAVLATGTAGEALTAGQAVYQKAADSKWYKADCNSATAEVRVASAIALGGAAAGQPVVVQKSGQITIGATVVAGTAYFLSGTAGGIRPAADNTTGDYPQVVGMGVSTTAIQLNFALHSPTAL